jgi:ATP phosphoribosyltransferase regulatory subunit HisZ
VDLRRAISAAYYAAFHATLAAAADLYVGAINRASNRYALVYRSVDHKELRELCSKVRGSNLSGKLAQYIPTGGFDANIRALAQALLELQEKRLDADYNPSIRVRSSDARLAVGTARNALSRLKTASSSSREAFLGLLLFKVR